MSFRVNLSPLLCARVPAGPQPGSKVRDVAFSPGMKGRTLLGETNSAAPRGPETPDISVLPRRAQPWPESAEGSPGMDRLLRKCQIRNQLLRECLAECLGVYVLIVSISGNRNLAMFGTLKSNQ